MLKAAPGLRAIAIFEEMRLRHPELDAGVRRTMERGSEDSGRFTARSRR